MLDRLNNISLAGFFFFLVIIALPIVDNLTGSLFKLGIIGEGGIGSPSQLARFSLFLFAIWLLDFSKNENALKKILIIFSYLMAVELFVAFYHFNFKAFLTGVVFSTKILFAFCCYFFIGAWLDGDKEKTILLIRKIIQYGTLCAFLVLLAYFSGFHISNYQIGIATRGLFISGNGLGVVLGTASILLAYFSPKLTLLKLMHIMLLVGTTALLGTKASMIFSVIALAVLYMRLAKQNPLITAAFTVLFFYFLLLPLLEILQSVFENIIFKFNKIDNKLSMIASSRDVFIKDAFEQVKFESWYSIRSLFGGGAFYAYTDFTLGGEFMRKKLENDLFELFFVYGLTAVAVYLGLYFRALFQSLKNRNFIIALTLSLIFFHSATVGHVLFNGTSAIAYAFCLALAFKGVKVRSHDF